MNLVLRPSPQRRIIWVGLLLTTVAGYVDALGFLRYSQIFTANMSGNHVRLGIDLVDAQWSDALLRLIPIAAFALGVILGELLVAGGRSSLRLRAVAPLWVMEAAALLAAVAGDRWIPATLARDELLLALLAVAMGAQNSTLRRTRSLNIYTTHVTGALTLACISLSKAIRRLARRGRASPSGPRWTFVRAGWRFWMLLLYVVGAAAGAEGLRMARIYALILPALLLLLLAAAFRHDSPDTRDSPAAR